MIVDGLTLPLRAAAFLAWFAVQVLRSSWAVLVDVVGSGRRSTPRVVRMPIGSAGGTHTTVISLLITLTPGTLVLGVAPPDDRGTVLLVHSMYHPDARSALAELQDMDQRLVRGMRWRRDS